ncbi:MAG: hypothetical protein GX840_01930 [Bacteroidales bacterium]|nr:hypothetical protein [Bacteroidales bacterium]
MTASGTEFISDKSGFPDNQWVRMTSMTYYQNDSIANAYLHSQYWWQTTGPGRPVTGIHIST